MRRVVAVACPLLVALFVAAPGLAAEDVRFVTGLVAARLQQTAGLDVLTRDDLRNVLDLEAEKQAVGCDESTSCLAEIALAMNARLVVYGRVDDLGGTYLLQLNLLDASGAQAIGRAVARAETRAELAAAAEGAASELAATLREKLPGEKMRVLVLDVESRAGVAVEDTPAEEPVAAGSGALFWTGAGLAALGAAGLVVGGAFDAASVGVHGETDRDLTLPAAVARERYRQSDTFAVIALSSYLAGGALVVGGAAALGLALSSGGEE